MAKGTDELLGAIDFMKLVMCAQLRSYKTEFFIELIQQMEVQRQTELAQFTEEIMEHFDQRNSSVYYNRSFVSRQPSRKCSEELLEKALQLKDIQIADKDKIIQEKELEISHLKEENDILQKKQITLQQKVNNTGFRQANKRMSLQMANDYTKEELSYKEEEVETLKGKIQKLERQHQFMYESMCDEVHVLKHQNEEQANQIANYKKMDQKLEQLYKIQSQVKDLQVQNENLQKQLEESKQNNHNILNLKGKVKLLKQKSFEEQEQQNELNDQLKYLRQQILDLEQQLQEKNEIIKTLEIQHSFHARTQSVYSQSETSDNNETKDIFEEKLNELQNQNIQSQRENNVLREELQVSRKQINELIRFKQYAMEQFEQFKSEKEALEKKNMEVQTEIKKFKKEMEDRKIENQMIKEVNINWQNQNEQLQQKIEELLANQQDQSQNQSNQSTQTDFKNIKEVQMEEVPQQGTNEIEKVRKSLKEEINVLQLKLQEKQRVIQMQTTNNEDLQCRNIKLQEKINTLDQEIIEKTEQAIQLQNNIQEKPFQDIETNGISSQQKQPSPDIKASSKESVESLKKYEHKIKSLKMENQQLRSQLASFQNQYNFQKKQIVQKQLEINDLNNRCTSYKLKLHQSQLNTSLSKSPRDYIALTERSSIGINEQQDSGRRSLTEEDKNPIKSNDKNQEPEEQQSVEKVQKLKQKNKELKQQIIELNSQIPLLQKQIKDAEAKKNETESTYDNAQKICNNLQNSLSRQESILSAALYNLGDSIIQFHCFESMENPWIDFMRDQLRP